LAQRASFTLAETGTLLDGFPSETPPWIRWQELARRKVPELDALIARAGEMKRLLEEGLGCECLCLEECGFLLRRCGGEAKAGVQQDASAGAGRRTTS
jgi:MerR, DNA binding